MIIQPTAIYEQQTANIKPKSFTALNINQCKSFSMPDVCTSMKMPTMEKKVEKLKKTKTKKDNIEHWI